MSTLSVATLSELTTLAQEYADMVNSNFVSPGEWTSYINLAYFELYNVLITMYGDDYFLKAPYTFTTDGVTFQYALPSDFYKFMGLDLQLGNVANSWVTIRSFMFADRNRYAVPNFQSFYGVTNLRYRIMSNSGPTNSGTNTGTLFLTPLPAANQTLRLWYIPRLTELVSGSDTVDGVSGFQDYIPVEAAIKALMKEESDVSALQTRKQILLKQIQDSAAGRDVANPQTVSDTQWSDYQFPANNGWGTGG
jgi:hypothetical protein